VRLTILLLSISISLVMVTDAVRPASLAAHAGVERPNGSGEIEPASQQPPERSMVGTLEQVDNQASEFVVKTTNGQQRFVLLNGATIRQGSKTIKASELASHKGERVKVRYRESSGERRAEWIVVASPPSHKVKTAGTSLR
jgi:hypothetical protein